MKSQLGVSNVSYMLQTGLLAVTLGPLINMFFAVGEEAGWRGYMMPCLKERFGLLNGRLLGGVIWGVWHWPLMLLVGYEYGTDYLGAPVLGLVVWCVFCFAMNSLLDLLYEKTSCIWVPAIAHGAFNAVAALFTVLTYPADAYYNVLGPAHWSDRAAAGAGSSGLAHAARDETGRKKLNPGSMSASSDAGRGAFLYNRKKA